MHLFRWHPRFQSHRAITLLLIIFCLTLVTTFQSVPVYAESNEVTATNATFGIEYAVPNGPRNLVEEAPGRIWYTATDAGGIGFLEVTSAPGDPIVRYRTEFYGLGEKSYPYDLVYDNGVVWFTLQGVRSLGKIDVVTRDIEVFPLLTVGAAPTGLDVDPNGQLWIAQNNGRISRFDPVTETFTEFVLTGVLAHAPPRIEDIVYQNARNIWFTMPDANRVATYDSVRNRFFSTATQELIPTGISIDPNGNTWVTAYGTNKVGRFTPTTVSIWIWFDTPSLESGPAGLLTFKDEDGVLQLWVTESKIGSIGRLQIANGFDLANREKIGPSTPAGSTWGIIRTADEHIWVADLGRNVLYELTAPYIHRSYMARLEKEQTSQELPD